jgi:hypothetical protein
MQARWFPKASARALDAWLERRRTAVFLVLWGALASVILVGYALRWDPPLDGMRHAIGRDFANTWTAARLALAGATDVLFRIDDYQAFQRELFGDRFAPHVWSYPPHLLPLIAPLGWIGYFPALALWTLAGLAAYAWAMRRGGAGWATVLALATAPAALVNVICGQNGFFSAACLMLGVRWLRSRPWAAGVLFGLLTVKPQLGLLIPLLLALDRNWRAFAAAGVTALAMLGASVALYGTGVVLGFVQETLPFQAAITARGEGLFQRMTPTPFMNARLWGLDAGTALWLQLPAALLGVAVALRYWRQTSDPAWRFAGLAAGTFLVSPYVLTYDMPILGPAIALLLARSRSSPAALVLLWAVWLLPLVSLSSLAPRFPVTSVPLVALGAWMLWRGPPAQGGMPAAGPAGGTVRGTAAA